MRIKFVQGPIITHKGRYFEKDLEELFLLRKRVLVKRCSITEFLKSQCSDSSFDQHSGKISGFFFLKLEKNEIFVRLRVLVY